MTTRTRDLRRPPALPDPRGGRGHGPGDRQQGRRHRTEPLSLAHLHRGRARPHRRLHHVVRRRGPFRPGPCHDARKTRRRLVGLRRHAALPRLREDRLRLPHPAPRRQALRRPRRRPRGGQTLARAERSDLRAVMGRDSPGSPAPAVRSGRPLVDLDTEAHHPAAHLGDLPVDAAPRLAWHLVGVVWARTTRLLGAACRSRTDCHRPGSSVARSALVSDRGRVAKALRS